MHHSTLVLALKEAFLELSAAQPGFFRYPGRGNWFGEGRAGGEIRVSKCALAKWRSAQVITSRTLRAV